MKNEKEIFIGEFVKAILKIVNISLEFEIICEKLNNLQLFLKFILP